MIKVYALSGSHSIGKTTTFVYLEKFLPPEKFAFVGEFAHWILVTMGIRDTWKKKIFTNHSAYNYFETALDFCTIASYLVHRDKIIIADRSIVDNCAYRLLAGLPLNTISLLDYHGINLYTFFIRSKKREDAEVAEAVRKILVQFELPFEEIDIIEYKSKETARIIADRILKLENDR